jgi:hypothetical protein
MFDRAFNRAAHYHLDYDDSAGTAKNMPLDEEEKYCEAYCEYNGGITRWYWDWKPPKPRKDDSGEWERSNDAEGSRHRDYADDVDSLRVNHPWH